MATKVKFLKSEDGDILAYFPQLNYNRYLYGNTMKTCYAHIGQHSAIHIDYVKECSEPTAIECLALHNELINIGYDIIVLNKFKTK
jgi:hypothetical protein